MYGAIEKGKANEDRPVHEDRRMTRTVSGKEQERLLDILNYWHKIEFFIPFDLDRHIEEVEEGRIRWLRAKPFNDGSSSLWKPNLPENYELKHFFLFLGIFDKGEIARVCEQTIGSRLETDEDEK